MALNKVLNAGLLAEHFLTGILVVVENKIQRGYNFILLNDDIAKMDRFGDQG